jgi:predicted MFS family arabinose efflux permease
VLYQYRSLVRARIAVFAHFACFGLVLATWAVHLPSVQHNTGASTSQLATLLLILGVGALIGMQICGVLLDRFSGGVIAVAALPVMAAFVVVPLAMTTWARAAFAVIVFGASSGISEVAMNAAAVDVERSYRRPIMGGFHAVFSVGNVVGSLISVAGFTLGVGVTATAGAVTVLCLIAIGCTAPGLLRGRRTDSGGAASASTPVGQKVGDRPSKSRVALLGALVFLLFLSEGSAMDWSSLHAQQHLGASPAIGALAFGFFVAAMTIGRFSVDRLAARVGPVQVVRWGSVGAATGLMLVMASPTLPLTLLGWTITGLGLAGGVPQVFTAAGNSGGASGRTLSQVVGIGYLAILAGPSAIGWLAAVVSLNTAFLVPLCAVLICAAMASVVYDARRMASAPST